MDRRGFLKLLGLGVAAAAASKWVPWDDLIAEPYDCLVVTSVDTVNRTVTCTGAYANCANCANQVAILKELYSGSKMEELVYKENPFITLVKREKNS